QSGARARCRCRKTAASSSARWSLNSVRWRTIESVMSIIRGWRKPRMIKTLQVFRLFLAGLLASPALGAHAQLSIEITGTGASRFPVIIPIFENEGRLPQSVTDVVRADLERSGLFTLIDTGPLPMPESVMPDLASVRARGADAVPTGSLIPTAGRR